MSAGWAAACELTDWQDVNTTDNNIRDVAVHYLCLSIWQHGSGQFAVVDRQYILFALYAGWA